jgi:hypothetical protein
MGGALVIGGKNGHGGLTVLRLRKSEVDRA